MDTYTIIMLVLMLGIFYFLLIRPENKRKKQAQQMRESLKKGDTITTIGGLMGKIVQINADSIVFETSEDRVRIEVAKWGISTNNNAPAPEKKGKKEEKELPADTAAEAPAADEAPADDGGVSRAEADVEGKNAE